MSCIKDKLAGKDGMTILWSLLALLVAMTVSIVLVTAANTMMHRVADDRDMEQSRLTLESAAQLIGSKVANTTVTQTKQNDGTYSYTASGPFATELQQAFKSVFEQQAKFDSETHSITKTEITVSGADMDTVTATFVMYPPDTDAAATSSTEKFNEYDVLFTLTSGSSKLFVWSKASKNVSGNQTVYSWPNYQVDSSLG